MSGCLGKTNKNIQTKSPFELPGVPWATHFIEGHDLRGKLFYYKMWGLEIRGKKILQNKCAQRHVISGSEKKKRRAKQVATE